ncbi:MAG: ion transporter [Sterolibacteriaceae bacterium]|nr:ion transporter [Candidatus Methylophosphatis haderslevensis]
MSGGATLQAAAGSLPLRRRIGIWLETPRVQRSLIALILVNAVILGLETSPSLMADWGGWLHAADRAILAVFVVEIGLRLAVHRLAFFRDAWSVFDLLVIAIALVPASGPLAVLRALRVLRVLRLITLMPSMKRVVGGLLAALPGLSSVSAIIGLIFYVAAVVATKLFGTEFPALFGDLGRSAFTLFQVMTLEGWAMEVVRPTMAVYPLAWVFFLIFILSSTFTLLNLFIAVIVNAIQQEHAHEPGLSAEREIAQLRQEIAALHSTLRSARAPGARARRRPVGSASLTRQPHP